VKESIISFRGQVLCCVRKAGGVHSFSFPASFTFCSRSGQPTCLFLNIGLLVPPTVFHAFTSWAHVPTALRFFLLLSSRCTFLRLLASLPPSFRTLTSFQFVVFFLPPASFFLYNMHSFSPCPKPHCRPRLNGFRQSSLRPQPFGFIQINAPFSGTWLYFLLLFVLDGLVGSNKSTFLFFHLPKSPSMVSSSWKGNAVPESPFFPAEVRVGTQGAL